MPPVKLPPQEVFPTSQNPAALQELYNSALQLHRAGKFAEAERGYRQILAANPHHADSLHLLGVLGLQAGQPAASAQLIRAAIEVDGANPTYYSNLGNALQAMGQTEEARQQYEQALLLKPDFVEALMNLGNTLQALGRREEAVTRYQQALALQPASADAHMNLGNTLQSLGMQQEALTHYEEAVRLHPGSAEAQMNLGTVLQAMGRLPEAVVRYEQALVLRPNYAEALLNLGTVLRALGRVPEAIVRLQQALAIRPSYPEAHLHLGNALHAQGKLQEAVAEYEAALALQPDYAEAQMNLGIVLQALGRVEEAARHYDQTLALLPEFAEAHVNRGLLQLLCGDFPAGWRNLEWRWQMEKLDSPRRDFAQPQWHGEPLHGKRILLHGEQGLGDCMMFLRYLPMVQAAGGTVLLELPAGLKRLGAQFLGLAHLAAFGDELPPFDLHCPLLSLPLALGTTLETIPAQVPYLQISPEAIEKAQQLPWPAEGLRVGLVWAGNPNHAKDDSRSMPLAALAPLLALKGVHFYSLQIGIAAEELGPYREQIVDLASATSDMADTAAQIAQLDLVISVDTSVAHLAGALARPVWVLLSSNSDWRWLLIREDSPWYPTARLFRQSTAGDWSEVIERVAGAMIPLIEEKTVAHFPAR